VREALEIRNRALRTYGFPSNEQDELELPHLGVSAHVECATQSRYRAVGIASAPLASRVVTTPGNVDIRDYIPYSTGVPTPLGCAAERVPLNLIRFAPA
jgi:hypothetical protein